MTISFSVESVLCNISGSSKFLEAEAGMGPGNSFHRLHASTHPCYINCHCPQQDKLPWGEQAGGQGLSAAQLQTEADTEQCFRFWMGKTGFCFGACVTNAGNFKYSKRTSGKVNINKVNETTPIYTTFQFGRVQLFQILL